MKIKKRFSFYLILTLVLSIIYLIFAIKPLGTEYQFSPEWKIDVASPVIKENSENLPLHCFKLGQSAGYFTEKGTVTNFVTFPFKASVSEDFYTIFNSSSETSDFFTPDGKKAGTIKETGFPFIKGKKIFVFIPGGNSFAFCGEDGVKEWQHDSPSPITAFDCSEAGIIAGYADGNLVKFNFDGKIIQQFSPGGSDYPVIAGASISSSGEYIASVSGQKKQRFTLAKQDENQTKIIFHEYIEKDDPRQQIVKFSSDDKYVFYTTKEYAGVVDIDSEKSSHIPIKGHAVSIKESGDNFFLLTKQDNTYSVYIIEKFATLTGSFSFQARSAFIDTCGNDLYIGKNSTISKITINRK